MTCYAHADRYDAGMMRCTFCGLFWELSDPNPPRCRQAERDEKTELTRQFYSLQPPPMATA
jgi:hypothetical protein